jgi:diguanylate cyclase (GGDEF)-like protein
LTNNFRWVILKMDKKYKNKLDLLMKLHTKITLLIVPIVVMAVLSTGVSSIYYIKMAKANGDRDAALSSLNGVKKNIEEFNHIVHQKLSAIIKNPAVIDGVPFIEERSLLNGLHGTIGEDDITGFMLMAKNGRILKSENFDASSINTAKAMVNEETIYLPEKQAFVSSSEILSNDEKSLGYVFLMRNTGFVNDLIGQSDLKNGLLLHKSELSKSASEIMYKSKLSSLSSNPTNLIFLNVQVAEGIYLATFINSVKFNDSNYIVLFLMLSGIAAVMISVLIVKLIQKAFISRLKSLELASDKISHGEYDLNIEENYNDEIGSLAKSFIRMSKSLKVSHDKNYSLAYFDDLTGMPNRRNISEKLSNAVDSADEGGDKLCFLLMDIDDFKNINDAFGHHVGDLFIIEIGKVITEEAKAFKSENHEITGEVIAARLAGDEFAILLTGLSNKAVAGMLASRLLSKISARIVIEGKPIKANASIGVAQYPGDGDCYKDLFRNCDMSMYEAKRGGKNNYHYCDSEINRTQMERIQLEKDIALAIKEDQFDLFFQPKVNIVDGTINQFEALIRWNHPTRGAISPNDFIPFAEETGSIKQIGMWVFNSLCRFVSLMEDDARWGDDFVVSFNVSSLQIQDESFVRFLKNSIKAYGVNPKHLEVEITEHSLAKDIDKALIVLNEIKSMGFSISLDDFGTGYSSLSYLEILPIDTIKIDKSFVNKSIIYSKSRSIIKTIGVLANGLNLNIVAEGVENTQQLSLVREIGCKVVQGYYFYKPMSFIQLNHINLHLSQFELNLCEQNAG